MQPDPSKQGNNYINQYPPMNQPPMGTGNVYPPNNAPPPPYGQYPQQPPTYQATGTPYYGQTPIYQQQGPVVMPVYRPGWNRLVATPLTSNYKTFLAISGIFYLIWAILDIGLEIGILYNSYYSTYYRGIWAGGYLIGGGIIMLVASCRVSYVLNHLIRLFIVALVLIIIGLILCIVTVANSVSCDSSYYWINCDTRLAIHLKIAILAVFIISTIHTVVNIIVTRNALKNAASATAPCC